MSHQSQLTAAGGLSTRINSTSSSSGRRPHVYETISRERWVEAIRRVLDGHYYCGQGTWPAIRNLTGCLVAQKAGNRREKGYVQVDPPCLTSAHKSEPKMAYGSQLTASSVSFTRTQVMWKSYCMRNTMPLICVTCPSV